MIIHIRTTPSRPKPKTGDIRTTKKHGLQIRIPYTIDGIYVVTTGRQLYEWKTPNELPNRWIYLIPEDYTIE